MDKGEHAAPATTPNGDWYSNVTASTAFAVVARPLCRLICTPLQNDRAWAWEACDDSTFSQATFDSLYACAENARQHGFEVDLLRAPLRTDVPKR